jgi:acetolactate synthase-1/2/3 large subunit
VSITGDGGFGWALQELATARQHELGVVTVVFSDGAFGNVLRTQEERFGGRVVGTRLLNPDFAALARAFGVDGVRADNPAQLRGALREALAAGRPALIEVPVGRMPSAWHLLADQASTPVRRPSAAR